MAINLFKEGVKVRFTEEVNLEDHPHDILLFICAFMLGFKLL